MNRVPSSFRDPSGQVYESGGEIFRTINECYRENYEALMASGLYEELTRKGLLVLHAECDGAPDGCWKMISPVKIPFVSYPYEWSFSQLREAALLTLNIMRRALKRGMCLKDSSAFNVQLLRGKLIFIDTLSFEPRRPGEPWVAYGQFCRHFLAPLLLMAYTDIRLSSLFVRHLDGVPLDLASKLLPARTRLMPGIFLHIHAHARLVSRYADSGRSPQKPAPTLPMDTLPALIDSLYALVSSIRPPRLVTEWGDYYAKTNYTNAAFESKKALVSKYLRLANPATVADLGANDGTFSRLAAEHAHTVISADIDPAAVDNNYNVTRRENTAAIVPVLLDLTNPTPALGWAGREWSAFTERARTDLLLALGLIHHMCISNNLPLGHVADYFASIAEYAVVEFVPKNDSNAARLLSTRKDIFPEYTQAGFEAAFGGRFDTVEKNDVDESLRTLYLLRRR